MKRVKLIATAAVLAVFAALGTVAAQDPNASERTFLTFSGPVELPGVTLQAGTYVFKLADTPSRNVVQVWNREENQMLGQWLFVQADRPEVTQQNVVMFKESPEGTTPAVQFWYYPGEKVGKEFIYPKDQAIKIAARTGQPVLTTEGEIDASDAQVRSVDAQGNITNWERAEASPAPDASTQGVVKGDVPSAAAENNAAAAPAPSDTTVQNAPASAQPSAAAGSLAGNRGVTAETPDANPDADVQAQASARAQAPPAAAARPEPRPAAQPEREVVGTSGQIDTRSEARDERVARANELPQTASPLPLSGLLGLLSLAGAYALRARR